jgi:protein-L-isoaspartate(D-aspartate) O-methyltransferase
VPGALDTQAAEARIAFLLALRRKGLRDTAVLRAFETVPRGRFAPHRLADLALSDIALPIGCGQSTVAPSLMAEMLTVLDLQPRHRVLEIGTGSGYGTALLARLTAEVVSVERFRSLVVEASVRLEALGVANATILHGDGREGAPGAGLFDRILIDAAVTALPAPLLAQLAPDGRIVAVERMEEGSFLVRYGRGNAGTLRRETFGRFALPPLMSGVASAL